MDLYESIGALNNLCPDEFCQRYNGRKYPVAVHVKYHSNNCNMDRYFNIMLPPDYDESKKYPVCYLLHGIMCNEFMFTGDEKNHVSEIFSNLIAENKAREMILVFPDIFARKDKNLEQSFCQEVFDAYDDCQNELIKEIIPYIESHYSVATGRENRAVAGFSMGGRETIITILNHPDFFDYAGAIAPAPGLLPSKDKFADHPGYFTEETFKYQKDDKTKFLMICSGDDDKVVVHFPVTYHKVLEKNNVKHLWFEVPGADHNDVAIRSGLYHFLQAAFK